MLELFVAGVGTWIERKGKEVERPHPVENDRPGENARRTSVRVR